MAADGCCAAYLAWGLRDGEDALLMGAGQHTAKMFVSAGCQHTALLSVCLAVCTHHHHHHPPTHSVLLSHSHQHTHSCAPPPSQINRLGVEFVKRPDDGKMKGLAFVKDPDSYWCVTKPGEGGGCAAHVSGLD